MGFRDLALRSVGRRSPEAVARQTSYYSHQNTLSSTRPHACTKCSYHFIFASSERNDLPYSASKRIITLGSLLHSAQGGCLFHQWLVNLLFLNIEGSNQRFAKIAEVEVSMDLQKIYQTEFIPHAFNQQEDRRLKWSARDQMRRTWTEPFIRYKYQAASCPYRLVISVQAVSEEGIALRGSDTLSFYTPYEHLQQSMDDGPYISRTPMIEWNKGSRRSMDFAISRLSTCRKSHLDCCPLDGSEQGRKSQPPTRLLDVKSASVSGIIRLVQSAKSTSSDTHMFKDQLPVDYAVLSYCWGGSEFIKLSCETHEMLLRGIRVNRLGQTIQDAVHVCNKMDIPYLWIDALCILQDNFNDKMRELSMMSTYYQDGVLTICAASAKSATDGFLASAEENAYCAGPFKSTFEEGPRTLPATGSAAGDILRRQHMSNKIQKMATHPNLDHVQLFKLHDEAPIEPIALRAWTFQEAILSTRLLIFASHQIYWSCRESYVGCGGIHNFSKTSIVHPDCQGPQSKMCVCGISATRQITPPDLVPGVFTLGQCNSMSTDAQWDMVVTNFSRRALTFESDKLVSFSAAASYFDTLFRARWPLVQYAAGLWFSKESPSSFIRQLLWWSENPSTAGRPESFRAPTWSWASINGEINQRDRIQMYIDYHVSITVVKVSTQLLSPTDPFSAIKSAQLVIQCMLRGLASVMDNDHLMGSSLAECLKTTPDTEEDRTLIASKPEQIQLMEVVPYTTRAASPIGLVLRRFDDLDEAYRGHTPRFRRLGLFCLPSCTTLNIARALFDGCIKEEICLV